MLQQPSPIRRRRARIIDDVNIFYMENKKEWKRIKGNFLEICKKFQVWMKVNLKK